MAEAEYNKKYYTTYQTGNNMYVEFEWERRIYSDPINLWCRTNNELVLKEYVPPFPDEDDIVYITDIHISGSGEAYNNVSDIKLKNTTDPYYLEYKNNNPNEDINLSYGACMCTNFDRQQLGGTNNIICCIEEIKVDEGITELVIPLTRILYCSRLGHSLQHEYCLARYIKLPKTLQKTGSMNYEYINAMRQQRCAFYVQSMGHYGFILANEIDIDCTNLQYIGRRTFIENVNIIEPFHCEVMEIASEAFYKYSAISILDLGKSINYIGEKAFYECENLIEINESNFLNCTCVGIIFFFCNKIEYITLGNDTIHYERDNYNNKYIETTESFIIISKGKGSNLYKGTDEKYEGFQVVNVITSNKLFLEYWYSEEHKKYIGTNWESSNVYVGTNTETGFLEIQSPNKVIMIKSYSDGDMEIAVGDQIKRVKLVELTDASASPVEIAVGNKIMALKF